MADRAKPKLMEKRDSASKQSHARRPLSYLIAPNRRGQLYPRRVDVRSFKLLRPNHHALPYLTLTALCYYGLMVTYVLIDNWFAEMGFLVPPARDGIGPRADDPAMPRGKLASASRTPFSLNVATSRL